MRPVRICVEGFAAFREPVEVDLADVDLFALVGPTGAGKSTLIDAMVFALYGCVPRYDSENLVHPVITQGALEAKVRLDFTVSGVAHTATRVVRRTKGGATTKEARLERDDGGDLTTVLADDAKALTAAVVDLLGLDLEQFTKCVVLPQGAFATLLHDTKAKRQDLLVKLLDLGVYERLASAARTEAKTAALRLEAIDEQLARDEAATDEVVAAAEDHLAGVQRVLATVEAATPDFEQLERELRKLDDRIAADDDAVARLGGVSAPDDVDDITHRSAEAAEAAELARLAEDAAAAEVVAAETRREALPGEADIRAGLAAHQTAAEMGTRVAKGQRLLDELCAQRPALQQSFDDSAAAATAAGSRFEQARIQDAAADLARHLHTGDACPVCGNEVVELPTVDVTALAAAEGELRAAEATQRQATDALAEHDAKETAHRSRLEVLVAERQQLDDQLAGQPAVPELETQLEAIVAADEALSVARRADAAARRRSAETRAGAAEAARRIDGARAEFHRVRDRVAALEPPASGDDLGTDWKVLVTWAEELRNERTERVAAARSQRQQIRERRQARCGELLAIARRAGVPVPGGDPTPAGVRDACVAEAASARTRLTQLIEARDRRAEIVAERDRLAERRQVHDLLAEHLGARGFEAWLLDEALDVLLDGASRWLEQLSSGRYALAVDDKNAFVVIDHANADERRLARTLSGGETFLASLALALALAEQVGELAAGGGRSLEAIFLDEGFGTLDPDTLDVVASAIEELGATGRMVGVVSHVRDLAERVPVRFEVTKAPGTSSVRRVEV